MINDFKKQFDGCYGSFKNEMEKKAARLKVKLIYREMEKRKEILLQELEEIKKLEVEEQKRFADKFMDLLK